MNAISPLLDTLSSERERERERERALIGSLDKERWQAASSDSGGLEGGKSGYNLLTTLVTRESLRRLNMSTLKFYYDCSSFCHHPQSMGAGYGRAPIITIVIGLAY
jgi:hypothetical protein